MKKTVFLLTLSACLFIGHAQSPADEVRAVENACFDYIHAFYKADTTLAYRSVHKSLRKTGFYWDKEKEMYSDQLEMPFDDLVALAKRWNADGSRADEKTPKGVEVFEISDKTAVAKVSAIWGIDYMTLMKMDGKWMIVNVLWQSPPRSSIRNP